MEKNFQHFPVLMSEVLEFSEIEPKRILDVTAGGGGHLCALIGKHRTSKAEAWDRDPRAIDRVKERLEHLNLRSSVELREKEFSERPKDEGLSFDLILADLGVSSFQFNPEISGMSLHSDLAPDFRMNPSQGLGFRDWLKTKTAAELEDVLYKFGEEPKARKLANALVGISDEDLTSAKGFAHWIRRVLSYQGSRIHPATRIFQAFRMAINNEFGQLQKFLDWAPKFLSPGGRLLVISFHSIEDRLVKRAFVEVARQESFKVVTKRPILPSDAELNENPASRSAKLRVLERLS
ncbi:16S rRNA (cytosine(1402)-N(4))-methyltransferase RsmH [bacterium]|nr:16S rRNA (cytosine(1402)-N(4))-methyltransferase RsmH [bacterium]